jgi:DNA repair photolyase
MADHYTNPVSLTSQFFFCGLPLRLDSYRGCAFQCSFCYARFRGGNAPEANVVAADPGTLRRVFAAAFRAERPADAGIIGQFLRQRVPVHFGGMSDPFQPVERRFEVTRRYLETLRDYDYPTVISTRSTMPAAAPYLELLREMKYVVVQFSFTSTLKAVSDRLEPHTPDPADLLRTMETLARHGIPVTCRWQPYVRGVSEKPRRFVRAVAAAGARHVAIEHLKLPVESNHPLWDKLVAGTGGGDLRAQYRAAGATRQGRELVLPASAKLPAILQLREAVREAGLTLGVADNEFQYLSDTGCCCSGVDQFPGFDGWFKHQIAHAVRRCRGQRRIVYQSVSRFWTPEGSVDRWLNSHSRIGRAGAAERTLDDDEDADADARRHGTGVGHHIRLHWNDAASPLSPAGFYGVEPTEEFTTTGLRVYRWGAKAPAPAPAAAARITASEASGVSRNRDNCEAPRVAPTRGKAGCCAETSADDRA